MGVDAPPPRDELARLRAAFAPRYVVQREIASGGMATVLLADDAKHARRVALKVMRPELLDGATVRRFLREIELTAGLVHPNVLPLLDSGEVLGLPYYAMPFVADGTLRDRLEREGPLPVAEAVALARELCDALAHAHAAGILHRDVKPANVMLAGGHALLADLGIAKVERHVDTDPSRTSTGLAVGTRRYMSPEQAAGATAIDGRSDVYGAGLVLRDMLDGLDARGEGRADVPPALRRIVARALAFAPADRFPSAAAMADALRDAERAVTEGAPPVADAGSAADAGRDGAQDALLQGRFFWNRRTDDDARRALACFTEAARLDPRCAPAHAGIADVWATRAIYGTAPPHEAMELARAAARAALAIDPDAAAARTSLALVRAAHDWAWDDARREFERAIAADARYATAHQWLAAVCLVPQRRFDEAVAALAAAIALDPLSPILHATLAGVRLYERRHDLAEAAARHALALDARCVVAHHFLGQALVPLGRAAEAVDAARRACALSADASETLAALGHAQAATGDSEGARAALRALDRRAETRYVPQTYLAQLSVALGEHDLALARLEAAADDRAVDLIWAGVKPVYDPIAATPRFRAVLARMGIA